MSRCTLAKPNADAPPPPPFSLRTTPLEAGGGACFVQPESHLKRCTPVYDESALTVFERNGSQQHIYRGPFTTESRLQPVSSPPMMNVKLRFLFHVKVAKTSRNPAKSG